MPRTSPLDLSRGDGRLFVMSPTDRRAFDPDPEIGAVHNISTWAKLYFDATIFDWQHLYYHYPVRDKCLIAGIRVGKSKGAAFGMLHFAQFHPGARLLNTSISAEQAKIVWYNMQDLIHSPYFKHWVERNDKSPYPSIRLINGAEIWFRSVGYEAELLRGFEFDFIHLDEGAYIQSEITVKTLRGRLLGVNPETKEQRAGLFWISSSPKGKSGWLYDRWKRGDPRFPGADPTKYLSMHVRTIDNPLLSDEVLAEIMADYTDRQIEQELNGEFIDADAIEFPMDLILSCCDPDDLTVRKLNSDIGAWREKMGKRKSLRLELGMAEDIDHYELEPQPGRQYLASWDLGKKATKEGRNATVGMVFDVTELPWKLVAYRYLTGTGYLPALALIEQWQVKYSAAGVRCVTCMDATGKGDVLNEIVQAENRFSVDGIVYNASLKPNLISAGKIAVERQLVRFPFVKRFVDQLSIYEAADKDLPQDTVMAFCQAMYKARELTGISKASETPRHALFYRPKPAMEHDLTRMYARRTASLTRRTGRSRVFVA